MAAYNAHLLGQIAVKEGFITPDQLEECIELQKAARDKPLGAILVAKGYLNREKLIELTGLQRTRFESMAADPGRGGLFGQLALRHGYVNAEQLGECLREQAGHARSGSSLMLGQILMKKGYLTSALFLEILRLQKKEVAKCPACDSFFDVSTAKGESGFPCTKCGTIVHLRGKDAASA